MNAMIPPPSPSPSRFRAWLLAARPKTLAASTVPVIVGSILAAQVGSFRPVPAALCFFFALWAQIGANFINDWADACKGSDSQDRIGPDRMVALGIIAPGKMLLGAIFAFGVACAFGLGLVFFGGWPLIAVGAVCVLFATLYSAGPLPLARCGFGDFLVVFFFGVVAVCYTFFLQTKIWNFEVIAAGLAVGFATDNILIANNYRDRREDRTHGKWTLIALFGERFGRYFYLASGILAATFFLVVTLRLRGGLGIFPILAPLLWFALHVKTWRRLCAIREGAALNEILEKSAKNLIAFALLFAMQTIPL